MLLGPDMRHCLIFQKIQMIKCCITRQVQRNKLVTQGKSRAGKAPAAKGSDDDNDNDSDSDFLSADEDMASDDNSGEGAAAAAAATNKAGASANANANAPRGVKHPSPTLRLLVTKEPLNIPVTQEEGCVGRVALAMQPRSFCAWSALQVRRFLPSFPRHNLTRVWALFVLGRYAGQ